MFLNNFDFTQTQYSKLSKKEVFLFSITIIQEECLIRIKANF